MNTKDIHERIWPAREAYDLVAPVYDNWYWKEFWERNEQPLIDKCISDERPPLAIDVGCGTGTYSRVLERISATVGIDPSVRMLAIAKRRALCSTSFIVAQASRLPFKDATVGLAIAARSLCHEKELDRTIEDVARIMLPGGLFVVSDVDRDHDYPRTKIPFGDSVVHIETYKRSSLDIVNAAVRTGQWSIERVHDVRWKELEWSPTDERFYHGVREGNRNVFFLVALRRR